MTNESEPLKLRLKTPEAPLGDIGDADRRRKLSMLSSKIAQIAGGPVALFGLEQKAAAYCAEHYISHDDLDQNIGPATYEIDTRRLLGRLSSEPIIYTYWKLFSQDNMTSYHINALAEVLAGPKGKTRHVDLMVGSEHVGFAYYPPPPPTSWADNILTLGRRYSDPITSAIAVFGVLMIQHPLEDGNGRLARALFWSRMAKLPFIIGPIAPLNFTHYTNPTWTSSMLRELGNDGDWDKFANRLLDFTNYSLELSLKMFIEWGQIN